jgi:hypothetical protein
MHQIEIRVFAKIVAVTIIQAETESPSIAHNSIALDVESLEISGNIANEKILGLVLEQIFKSFILNQSDKSIAEFEIESIRQISVELVESE